MKPSNPEDHLKLGETVEIKVTRVPKPKKERQRPKR